MIDTNEARYEKKKRLKSAIQISTALLSILARNWLKGQAPVYPTAITYAVFITFKMA